MRSGWGMQVYLIFFQLISVFLGFADATKLILTIGSNEILPDPSSLHSSSNFARLYSSGQDILLPLTVRNGFEYDFSRDGLAGGRKNVSYVVTIESNKYSFEPLRVDVSDWESSQRVNVWRTSRGYAWSEKAELLGEGLGDDNPAVVQVYSVDTRHYFIDTSGFSFLAYLKNPMILLGLFSLFLITVMPRLMDSIDPETRAELDAMQQNRTPKISSQSTSKSPNITPNRPQKRLTNSRVRRA